MSTMMNVHYVESPNAECPWAKVSCFWASYSFISILLSIATKYQRFGCMFRVVICVLKDEEQIEHLVLPCWQSMVFREATQWREAQVGGKVANSTSRYKPAQINLSSPWPPSFVKPDTHLERKFGKNCNAMLPEMKRGKFSRMTIKSEYSQKMILRLMGEDADDIGWESWWRRTPDVCQLEGICLRDQIRNNLPTCRPATWPQLPNISHIWCHPRIIQFKNLIY